MPDVSKPWNDAADRQAVVKDGPSAGPPPKQLRKVFIMGGPGSGKTTLGQRLAQIIGGPLYELDIIGYEGGSGAERSLDDRLRDVATIACQSLWVAEGTYIDWTTLLAEKADAIVWLDPPWRVARYRILMRHVKASLRRSNKHAGLRNLWRFVYHCRGYYTGPNPRRRRTEQWLVGYIDKAVICQTNRDVEQFVARVQDRAQPSRVVTRRG